MRFELTTNIPYALSFDDVLLVPKYSQINSRSDINLKTILSKQLTLDIPLITTNMDTVTGVEMAIAISKLGGIGVLPRFETEERQIQKVKDVVSQSQRVAASVGIKNGSLKRAEMLVEAGATALDVDVAHGHMQQTIDFTNDLKNKFGDKITIMSGIVATGEAADALYSAGADVVTVGVGGGSICSTRIQTGCGIPTFASLIDVQKVARKHKKTYIPLAGIKNSGDIVKSLAAGASAIRGGNLFAGTDETPGNIITFEGKRYKQYNGSTSEKEKIKHVEEGTVQDKMYTKHIEGYEGLIPYKGPLEDVVIKLLAGVRSGISYCGAKNIPELWEKAEFIRVTSAGNRENGAHDILTVKG